MKSHPRVGAKSPVFEALARHLVLPWLALQTVLWPLSAATNVIVWDTVTPLGTDGQLGDRTNWREVPTELFRFEIDPAKAASDPGYYGREYAFHGDAVVENRECIAAFCRQRGRVVLYAKASGPGQSAGWVTRFLELHPLGKGISESPLGACEIVWNAADEAILRVALEVSPPGSASAVFVLGRDGSLEVRPEGGWSTLGLESPLAHGVVPEFGGDDLIFHPDSRPQQAPRHLPAEQCFLGLLPGEASEFVLTWPVGRQQLRWSGRQDAGGEAVSWESLELDLEGQPVYLTLLQARGIWHQQALPPSSLEKDWRLEWRPPYSAKWKTQLLEAGVRTTFNFRRTKAQIWRGVTGSYVYPAWMEGGDAFFHLSKKVPPKGESLVYCLEPQETPKGVVTPVDVLKSTLGRSQSSALLDAEGRRLRTHHRRGGEGVHRACTCGCTEYIQAIFEAGEETSRQDEIREALADMNYFVERHVARIAEYQRFAAATVEYLKAQTKAAPDVGELAEALLPGARAIQEVYAVQRTNMQSAEHAAELTKQTMALTSRHDAGNLEAYLKLLDAWRAMGGAQDDVLAHCHTLARKLAQEAGYGGTRSRATVALAREVRSRCRQILRNPDGYEIWADY